MNQLLGLVLISFVFGGILLVPFIDLLFALRKKYKKRTNLPLDINSPIHNQILKGKDTKVPVGGGLLLIPVIVTLSILVFISSGKKINVELYSLIFTIVTFGYIGLLDDVRKIFTDFNGKFAGLRSRYILLLQTFFAFLVSLILYYFLGLNNIFIPILGNIILGWWYIPLAVLSIVSFANAYNISDGLDGLSTGLLLICLFAFLVLAHAVFDQTISSFVGIWIGVIIAYLYFNVFPARIYLGDAGAFGFGATLAVVGLLTGKIVGLGIIGGVYIMIVASSLIQILSKKFFKKKFLPITPIHMYLKYIGWEEPKIVVRFWLVGVIFAIFGLWLSLFSK